MSAPTRAPERRRTTPTARRIGYAIAAVVNVVLLWLVLVWPGWQAVPFVTADAASVIPLVTASLMVGVGVNAVNVVADSRALRALGDIVTSIISLVATVQVWRIFPFDLPEAGFDWVTAMRVLLILAMAGIVLGIIGNIVLLARIAGGAAHR